MQIYKGTMETVSFLDLKVFNSDNSHMFAAVEMLNSLCKEIKIENV